MTNVPSCPRCGSPERVEPEPAPEPRPGRPLLDTANPWPFWCGTCSSVFTGTADEWERMRRDRDRYQTEQNRSKEQNR